MPRKLLKQLLPSAERIKSNRHLRPIDKFLHQEQLWHIHQRNIAKACFIGVFISFIPIPGHTLIVALLAILCGGNIIVSIVVSWILGNPLTYGFIFYLDYVVGSKIVGVHAQHFHFELTWEWMLTALPTIGLELFIGGFICGLAFGSLSYWIVRLLWRWRIVWHWKQRKLRRISKPALR